MIKVTDLTFSWSEKPLFIKACFSVNKGQKVGLVGPNGSGKSTLFSLLRGVEQPDGGKIEVKGTIGFVPQEVKSDPDLEKAVTVHGYVDPGKIKKDFELKKILAQLQLGKLSLASSPTDLSGGQKTKLALARALVSEPEILLLDEPTNFMDQDGKKWVMDFLSRYPKTLLLISHDLKLMDQSIDKLLVINSQTQKIETYKGNYTQAIKLKTQQEALARRQAIAAQKHLKDLEEGLQKLYRYTSKKGVRARVILARRIERLKESLPELPQEIRRIRISLPEPGHVGELPLLAKNINKSFGATQILTGVDFSVKRGERVALVGPNGAGKSTFLKILTGQMKPDTGEVIVSPSLQFGYYSQEFETFDRDKTVLETFMDDCQKNERFARPFLGRFMFLGNKVFGIIDKKCW